MKQHCLEIVLDRQAGALLRVLGTVERRGFRLCAVQTQALSPGQWRLRLIVEGERAIEVLCRQLERLVDVQSAGLSVSAELAVSTE